MIVQHNIPSLNAWRNLYATNQGISKSMEKLSSGFRINRAADDAAGLAISEKMRAQVRGLNMAVKNAQDGISLIQTAEGALNEYHAILQRMRELSIQASNRIQTPEDLQAIQDEINQLKEEANRIAVTTEFNKQKLFDGNFSGRALQVGANAGQTITLSIDDMTTTAVGARWLEGSEAVDVSQITGLTAGTDTLTINGVDVLDGGYATLQAAIDAINAQTGLTGVEATQAEQTVARFTGGLGAVANDTTLTINGRQVAVNNGDTLTAVVDRINLYSSETGVVATADGTDLVLTDASGKAIEVQAGASDVFAETEMQDTALHTFEAAVRLVTKPGGTLNITGAGAYSPAAAGDALDLNGVTATDHTVNTVSVMNQADASASVLLLDFALGQVSDQRSTLGALQNRLDHTINNLQVAAENLNAAESRIRDVDMAAEMATFTKHQILLQAGTAMLAQANAVPQSVLQLLG